MRCFTEEICGVSPKRFAVTLNREKGGGGQGGAIAILEKHAIPLPDEALEAVAGGYNWIDAVADNIHL